MSTAEEMDAGRKRRRDWANPGASSPQTKPDLSGQGSGIAAMKNGRPTLSRLDRPGIRTCSAVAGVLARRGTFGRPGIPDRQARSLGQTPVKRPTTAETAYGGPSQYCRNLPTFRQNSHHCLTGFFGGTCRRNPTVGSGAKSLSSQMANQQTLLIARRGAGLRSAVPRMLGAGLMDLASYLMVR